MRILLGVQVRVEEYSLQEFILVCGDRGFRGGVLKTAADESEQFHARLLLGEEGLHIAWQISNVDSFKLKRSSDPLSAQGQRCGSGVKRRLWQLHRRYYLVMHGSLRRHRRGRSGCRGPARCHRYLPITGTGLTWLRFILRDLRSFFSGFLHYVLDDALPFLAFT